MDAKNLTGSKNRVIEEVSKCLPTEAGSESKTIPFPCKEAGEAETTRDDCDAFGLRRAPKNVYVLRDGRDPAFQPMKCSGFAALRAGAKCGRYFESVPLQVLELADRLLDPYRLPVDQILAYCRGLDDSDGGYSRNVVAFHQGKWFTFLLTADFRASSCFTVDRAEDALYEYSRCDTRPVAVADAFPGVSIPDEVCERIGDGKANCTPEQARSAIGGTL